MATKYGIWISEEHYLKLGQYGEASGQSREEIVDEILRQWWEVIGSTRLEAFRISQPKSKGSNAA